MSHYFPKKNPSNSRDAESSLEHKPVAISASKLPHPRLENTRYATAVRWLDVQIAFVVGAKAFKGIFVYSYVIKGTMDTSEATLYF